MLSFAPTRIALAVAAAFSAFPAHALSVKATMQGSLSNNYSPVATSGPLDPSPISGNAQFSGPFGQSSFYFGDIGTGATNIRVLTALPNKGNVVETTLVYTALVTNDTDRYQEVSFSFFIGNGRVGVNAPNGGSSSGLPITYAGQASLVSAIEWGGDRVWGVDLSVDTARDDRTVIAANSAADFVTHEYGDDAIYYDSYSGNLGLGLLSPGQSKYLQYNITGTAFYTSENEDAGFYGYGGRAVVGNADPFAFDTTPIPPSDFTGNDQLAFATMTAAVPEPESYAMLGLGLLGVAWVARHRRRPG